MMVIPLTLAMYEGVARLASRFKAIDVDPLLRHPHREEHEFRYRSCLVLGPDRIFRMGMTMTEVVEVELSLESAHRSECS
jgi:hypothetical protein